MKKKTFAFQKSCLNQIQSQTQGIGIGLSTAEALAKAVGGYLKI
jgi:hypothetical protein